MIHILLLRIVLGSWLYEYHNNFQCRYRCSRPTQILCFCHLEYMASLRWSRQHPKYIFLAGFRWVGVDSCVSTESFAKDLVVSNTITCRVKSIVRPTPVTLFTTFVPCPSLMGIPSKVIPLSVNEMLRVFTIFHYPGNSTITSTLRDSKPAACLVLQPCVGNYYPHSINIHPSVPCSVG